MSEAKFQATKQLINEQKYSEARAILKTIDHPTAREWEAKLDQIAPLPKRKKSRIGLLIFAIIVLIAAAVFTINSLNQQLDGQRQQLDTILDQRAP